MNDKTTPAASGAAPADWRPALHEARELAIKHGAVENDGMQMSVELYMTPTTLAKVIAEARARTALASPQVAPAGFKLVPIEPTKDMLDDGYRDLDAEDNEGDFVSQAGIKRLWNAMLKASVAPVAPQDDARDAALWREHVAKLDALVTYCPTCCQGFTALPELTRDQVIFECGKTAGRVATPVQVAPTAAAEEPLKWRCFHCEEVFTTRDSAREHFGSSEMQSPACQIDIAEYREMEARMRSYNDEDAEIHRAMYRMQGDHATALLREEEKGYARGLEGAKKHPQELGLQPIATAAPAPVAPQDDARDAATARALINLEGLADRLLAPREIVRDVEGYLIHPDVPACDEDVRTDVFLSAFGLDTAFVGMEDDCDDEDLIERVLVDAESCLAWTPTPPEGAGWVLLEIYPTEDGPYAMFARTAVPKGTPRRRDASTPAAKPAEEQGS